MLGKLAFGETLHEFRVSMGAIEPEVKRVKHGSYATESHGEQKYLLEGYFLFGQSGAIEQGEGYKTDGKNHVVGPRDGSGNGVEKVVARNYRQNKRDSSNRSENEDELFVVAVHCGLVAMQ